MNWTGVLPALTTKFKSNGELDMTLFFKNMEAQIAAGVDAIILGGTLGESSVLSREEKIELTRLTIQESNGRVPVILNIAEGSTVEARRWAQDGEKLGVGGFMLLPPMRYPSDHRETVKYFKAVASETKKEIMLYNNPVDYKTLVTLEMFDELIAVPNIKAVKESTRDISNVTRMLNRFGERIKILCGVDTLAMESLLMGAHGWVAGLVCAFPKETMAVYKLCKTNRVEEARKIYQWFLPLLELDIHPKLVQYIKLAEQVEGIGSEYVREPRLPLIGDERKRILNLIEEKVKNRPTLPTI